MGPRVGPLPASSIPIIQPAASDAALRNGLVVAAAAACDIWAVCRQPLIALAALMGDKVEPDILNKQHWLRMSIE